ncbi:MAG: transposase [Gammaproteobacteria bacterium]|nr:transposase [Gammaproteobacteria bacterium]
MSIASQIYLITTVTHKRKPVFRDLYAGRILAKALHGPRLEVATLCYVIMPDHLHWLVQLGDDLPLDKLMQRVKSASGFHIKRQWQLPGRLWQAGYHDHALRKDEDIKSVARYVIANPLRAGLVDRVGDYALWDAVWL